MTQVNLLPQEVKSRQRARRVTTAAVGSVLAVVVLLMAVFVIQSRRLHSVDHQLTAAQTLNSGLQVKIAQLQKFAELRKDVQARQTTVNALLQQQVLWSQVLASMSSVMPENVQLTQLDGSTSASDGTTGAATAGTAVAGPGLVATISLSGNASDFHQVATLLTRLERVDGWVNSWVSTATKADATGPVAFTASVDLTAAATVNGRPL